jgi:hypothetical protein
MPHTRSRFSLAATGLGVLAPIALAALLLRSQLVDAGPRMLYPPDPVNGVLAYDLRDAVPTTYGAFTETAASLVNGDERSEVTVALRVDNDGYLPIQAPAVDQLRMVTTDGLEATYLDGGWGMASLVGPRSSTTGEFHFAAPPAGGMLILEYRERTADAPIRIAVGYALERANAASMSPAESQQ